MAYVDPIKTRKELRCAEQYLNEYHDPAFALAWRIGIESGLRISDILRLKYSDINLSTGVCEVVESKGALSRRSKAKYRVLKQVKKELLLYYQTKGAVKKMSTLYIISPKNMQPFIPNAWQPIIANRIRDAITSLPKIVRHFCLSSKLLKVIRKRQKTNEKYANDDIFNRQSLQSNRAKGQKGRLTRQACWRVFSKLSAVLKEFGVTVKVGCHSLRKSFARHLYFATGKDIGLLMTMIGHQSERMSLHYIGVSKEETEKAQKKLITYLAC